MRKPKFLQNMTRKMYIIWALSAVGLIVAIFGITSITMVAIPKTYGASIDLSNVRAVRYLNDNTSGSFRRGKPLIAGVETFYDDARKEIVNLLARGGKTNTLSNLFRGNPKQVVENNNTETVFTSTFETNYSKNAIEIEFAKPQYSIREINRTTFELLPAGQGDRDIYSIMIPLDNVGNRFQTQTWYLVSQNRTQTSAGSSLSISNKFTTYGNYKKLWETVRAYDLP